MAAFSDTLSVRTTKAEQALDVTDRVRGVVRRSGIRDGVCLVFARHTTAAVFVNENADPDVPRDVLAALRRAVPDDLAYRHAEGNGPAHVRTVLTGESVTLPVAAGDLALGTWQGVFLAEFDGPRERSLAVTVVG